MQPYFFPYMGHFSLVAACEKWVVFDDSQYTSRSWMNRNRVLHPSAGWSYINLPVHKTGLNSKIKDVLVVDKKDSWLRVRAQLAHYKNKAPFYNQVLSIVDEAFSVESHRLVDINVSSIKSVCRYLNVAFDYTISSRVNFDYSTVREADDWAFVITRQMGGEQYVNPSSGRHLFSRKKYIEGGIDLLFHEFEPFVYDCGQFKFESSLSILDVLMWNTVESVRSGLSCFKLSA